MRGRSDFNLFSLVRGHHVLFVNAVQTDTFIGIDNDDSRGTSRTYKFTKDNVQEGYLRQLWLSWAIARDSFH